MPKYGSRIRTPTAAGSGAGPPSTASATVHIGPDYGTTNQKVELHLSHPMEQTNYPMTEELSLRPTTYTQAYLPPMIEELHIGSVEQTNYSPPMTEELHIGPSVEMPRYVMTEELSLRPTRMTASYPMIEELSLRPSTFTASYPMTEELHIGPEVQKGAYVLQTEELHIGPVVEKPVYPMIEELHMSGTVQGPPQWEAVVSTFSTAVAGSSNITVSTPTTVPGQFLLAIVGSNSTAGFTTPVGWTLIRNTVVQLAAGCSLGTFFRFVVTGDSTSVSFAASSAAAYIGSIHQFSAVDATTPVSVSGATTASAVSPVAPSITPTRINNMLIACCAQNNALTQTYTPPANYTERADQTGTGPATLVTGENATRVQGTSGATGAQTMVSNQAAASNYCAQHIALNGATRVIA